MVLILIPGIFLLMVLVFLAGPRVKIDTAVGDHPLPGILDLDEYLAGCEANFPDLVENTEKIIKWHTKRGEKTSYSIVYIHGFTASRQETMPVTDLVAKGLRANVFYCRLKGHGRDAEALKDTSVHDWVNDVHEAYEIGKKIGEKVIVIANSTGAPLGLWLCSQYAGTAAVVLLSPNFAPADIMSNLILWPWGNVLVRLLVGKYMQWDYVNELHSKYWTTRFRSEALLTMMGVCKLTGKLALHKIQLPVLCLYTENDKVVSVPAIKRVFRQLGSSKKKIINTQAKDHILSGDIISPEMNEITVRYMLDFLKEVL